MGVFIELMWFWVCFIFIILGVFLIVVFGEIFFLYKIWIFRIRIVLYRRKEILVIFGERLGNMVFVKIKDIRECL